MERCALALSQLLERERQAALRADIDALSELQPLKQELVAGLRASERGEHSQYTIDSLADQARANIGLIRQLVVCLRGALGIESEATYTPAGRYLPSAARSLRGVL